MGYTKIIQSGDLIEKYEYQFDLPKRVPKDPKRGRVASRDDQLTEEGSADRLHKRRVSSINRCRQSFHRLVRANLSKTPPVLLTLTMLDVVDIDDAYDSYHEFGQRLRRIIGSGASWIAVPEFQTRGAVHFHVLMWDLPSEYATQERNTRRIQNLWQAGYVDCISTDGSPKLATYLAKYMSKAMHDERLVGKRAYSASRNVMRPLSLTSPTTINHACEIWGIDESTKPTQEREYDAHFMGRCKYKTYSLHDLTETDDNASMQP